MSSQQPDKRVFRVHFKNNESGIFLETNYEGHRGDLIKPIGRNVEVMPNVVPKEIDPLVYLTFEHMIKDRDINDAIECMRRNPPRAGKAGRDWVIEIMNKLQVEGYIFA